jgi:hypothetical protein
MMKNIPARNAKPVLAGQSRRRSNIMSKAEANLQNAFINRNPSRVCGDSFMARMGPMLARGRFTYSAQGLNQILSTPNATVRSVPVSK